MQASHPLSHRMALEAQSPPRKALLQVSEESYKPNNEWKPSALFAMRYVLPLVPKTLAQRRLLKKAAARKRKLAEVPELRSEHQPFSPARPPQPPRPHDPKVKREPPVFEDIMVFRPPRDSADFEIKSSPEADPVLHEFVYARDWDAKMGQPVINFPVRKFRVTRRDPGGVIHTLSDIDLPVTFVQPPPSSDVPCVSTCNEYVLLQLRRRSTAPKKA